LRLHCLRVGSFELLGSYWIIVVFNHVYFDFEHSQLLIDETINFRRELNKIIGLFINLQGEIGLLAKSLDVFKVGRRLISSLDLPDVLSSFEPQLFDDSALIKKYCEWLFKSISLCFLKI
jgi:hypothetical protein